MRLSIANEIRSFEDADTRAQIIKWTDSAAKDQHLYFTSPSVTDDGRWLVIISERSGGPDLYALHREDRTLSKLTRAGKLLRSYTYPMGGPTGLSKASPYLDAVRNLVYWIQDDSLWRADLECDGEAVRLCDLPNGWVGGYSHISADGSRFCIACTDPRAFSDSDRNQQDQLRKTPWRMLKHGLKSAVLVICTQTGAILRRHDLPFWVTHVQFDPQNIERLLCNSEGGVGSNAIRKFPYWGRIWMLEPDGNYRRFYDQAEWRSMNHENWNPDGSLILYHGREALGFLSRWKTRLCSLSRRSFGMKSNAGQHHSHFVEALDRDGRRVFSLATGHPVSHAIMAWSGVDFLMDSRNGFIYRGSLQSNGGCAITVICRHRSSMVGQDAHPHPVWTTKRSGVVYTSDADGSCNVYEAEVSS